MGTTGSFSSLFLFRIRDFMLNKMELRQNFINSYAFCTVSFRPKAFTTRLIVSKRGAES